MRTFRLILMVLFALFFLICDCYGVYQRIGEIELMSVSPVQVEVVGNLAYTLESHLFNIFDISDPLNPILLGNTYFNSELRYMQIRDNYAFISGSSAKFIVLDISDNTSPTIIDEITFGNVNYSYIKRFCLDGNYAYLDYYNYSSYDMKLMVVDISDPYNCSYVNDINTSVTTDCMFINDHFLFLFGFGSYLGCAFDITDSTNPVLFSTYSDFSLKHAEVISNMVYSVKADDFKILDFSDPLNIVEIVHYENDHSLSYVTILNNKAYLACGERGFKILDITDIEQITEIGAYDTRINGSQGAIQLSLIDENTVILTEWSDDVFIILDVSDPEPPASIVTGYNYPCRERNIDLNDNLLVFFDFNCVNFWEVSDFNNPISLYSHSFVGPIGSENVYMTDDHVFVTFRDDDYIRKLFSFDTSDVNNIHLEGSCNISTRQRDMGVYDNYLYLPSYHWGLEIYDYSAGSDPIFVAIYPNYYGSKMEIVESYAFMPLIDEVVLLDISNPSSITQIASWPMTPSIVDLLVEDDILFNKHFDNNTITIYDITDVLNPVYLNEIQLNPTSKLAWDFFIFDHKIYISDLSLNEIVIYDITNPANPIFDNSIRWNLKTWDMVAKDNYLFVGNHYFGSTLFDTSEFTSSENQIIHGQNYLKNFPNPFNPSTNISYQLSQESKSRITIFNLKGQKVNKLIDEWQGAGQHSVVWNGTDDFGKKVSSGIYFYRLNINGRTESVKKCLLLK